TGSCQFFIFSKKKKKPPPPPRIYPKKTLSLLQIKNMYKQTVIGGSTDERYAKPGMIADLYFENHFADDEFC
ncbi:MAG: hypothetical protein OEY01_10645, partial [Desulfobulbaceae bacterium]|nr:hypothetical protein [Desulfobulbaceae bacterium]